jgi:hypothetical protein
MYGTRGLKISRLADACGVRAFIRDEGAFMKIRTIIGVFTLMGGLATTTFAGERRIEVRDDHRPVVVEARHDDRVIIRDDHHDRFFRHDVIRGCDVPAVVCPR